MSIPEEPEDYGLSSHELKYQAEQVMSAEEVDAPVARSNPHLGICNARSRTPPPSLPSFPWPGSRPLLLELGVLLLTLADVQWSQRQRLRDMEDDEALEQIAKVWKNRPIDDDW